MVCNAIATISPDDYLLADLSRDYPGQLPGCQGQTPGHHRLYSLDSLPPLEQLSGSVVVLAGLSGNVYFHWMVDILPRLEILRRSGVDLDQVDWFLVNSDRQPFQQATLKHLGIPDHKMIESDRHPHLQAQELIVPSFPGYLGWLQPWALEFLRREFLPLGDGLSQDYPERIYISRTQASYRRILNEAAVTELLSHHGFVSVQLELLPLAQQIALFANASLIVTAHGSGLTNTIFCRSGATVVELVSPHYVRHYYWVISKYLGLQHYYLPGERFGCTPIRQIMYPNPLIEDIWVNLEALKNMLKVVGVADQQQRKERQR